MEEYNRLLIAHGCGEVNGLIYTNSLEAVYENYKAGFRRFEIDLHLTRENDVISLHNVLGYNFIPKEQFEKMTIKRLFTGITDLPITVNSSLFIPTKNDVVRAYRNKQLTLLLLWI